MIKPDLRNFWVLSTKEQDTIREAYPSYTEQLSQQAFLNMVYDLSDMGEGARNKRLDEAGRSTARVFGKDVYCPLLFEDTTFCDGPECDDTATWRCYPLDRLAQAIALCDRCKQERMRDDLAERRGNTWNTC